ncbi:hypothetical protein J6590_103254, partial [Homalodisca vitripennis]
VVFLAVTLLAVKVAAISDTSDTPGNCCELHRIPCCRSCYTPIPGTLCYCDQPCNSDYGKCCPDDSYVCLNEASEQCMFVIPRKPISSYCTDRTIYEVRSEVHACVQITPHSPLYA